MTTRCSPRSSAARRSARCRWCMPRTATSSRRCRRNTWTRALPGPEAHAYSRPPEVEGEATNRAIMIADAAGVPVYIVHTSSEQAHEAIRRARQKGMRVYGEPLIQHLTLDETRVLQQGLGLCRAARDEPALPRQEPPGFALGRAVVGLAAGGGDRPLRLHHRAEAHRHRRFHQDPERHRRARGPARRCSGPRASRPAASRRTSSSP